MQAEDHIKVMHLILEAMTVDSHIDNAEKYAAAEEVSVALSKLKEAVRHDIDRHKT